MRPGPSEFPVEAQGEGSDDLPGGAQSHRLLLVLEESHLEPEWAGVGR